MAVESFTLAEFSPEVIKNELNAWLLSKGCLEFVDAITIEKYAETVSIWKIATERVKEQGYTIFNDRGVKIVNPNWKVSSEALKQSNDFGQTSREQWKPTWQTSQNSCQSLRS